MTRLLYADASPTLAHGVQLAMGTMAVKNAIAVLQGSLER